MPDNICEYKGCSREKWENDDKYCIFHSKKVEEKKDEFNREFRKQYPEEFLNDNNVIDLTGFIFPDIDFFKEKTVQKPICFFNSTFKGKANFRVSKFEEGADFRNSTFEGAAEFKKSTFEGAADFRHSTFKEKVFFIYSTFKGKAYFWHSTFEGGAEFRFSTFEGVAYFWSSTFKEGAEFFTSTFEGATDFRNSTFEGATDFRHSTFKGIINFRNSTFEEGAYFLSSTFKGVINFKHSTFEEGPEFRNSTFEEGAYFWNSTFEEKVVFIYSTFKGKAYFWHSTFEGGAEFRFSTFEERADFRNSTFEGTAGFGDSAFYSDTSFKFNKYNLLNLNNCLIEKYIDFRSTDESQPKITKINIYNLKNFGIIYIDWNDNKVKNSIDNGTADYSEKAEQYRTLKENYRKLGWYDQEDKAYVEFRKNQIRAEQYDENKNNKIKNIFPKTIDLLFKGTQEEDIKILKKKIRIIVEKPGKIYTWFKWFVKKIKYFFKWLFFEQMGKYGTSPGRIASSMFIVISLFCLPYMNFTTTTTNGIEPSPVFHSIITFLTIGYAHGYIDLSSFWAKFLSGLEGFAGLFLMSYFTIAFVRKVLR